ncbi:MAG: hypothetical protein H0X33_10605 [Taibaiella sp.]|nr:hypothetical protein [Taibaiella sp.]
MATYLFQIAITGKDTDDYVRDMRLQKEYINVLLAENSVLAYGLADNEDTAWCVLNTKTKRQAINWIHSFPMYKYYGNIECHTLSFHMSHPSLLVDISLN